MPYSVEAVLASGPGELRSLAIELQKRAPADHAVLTLTATTDPSARERGLIPALRAALESSSEPAPRNLRNAWGDWPKDLFETLAAQVETFQGLGAYVVAGPNGQCELFQTEGAVRAVSYYLAHPVTFLLLEAAAALEPVIAVEVHRTSAVVRAYQGLRLVSESPVAGPDEPRSGKSGAEGQEHADRHAREMEAHFIDDLARAIRPALDGARALVLIGDQQQRRALRKRLATDVPFGELEWNPDMGNREWALAVGEAADAAIGRAQADAISRTLEGNSIVQDWQTAAVAAREGRLHEVWLNPAAALHISICNQCGTVVEGPEHCPNCLAAPYDRMPAAELVVRGAQQTSTRVHFACGDAVEVLARGTGLVGRWRY